MAIINDIFEAQKIPAVTEVTPLPGELTPEKIKERGAILDFLATDNSSAYKDHLEWFNDYEFQLKSTVKKEKAISREEGKEEGLDEGSLLMQAILDLKDQGKTLDEVKQILKDRKGLEKY